MTESTFQKDNTLWVSGFLILSVLFVYGQVLQHEFITYDDPKDKKTKRTVVLSDWVENVAVNRPMLPKSWTYTGSLVVRGFYLADSEGAVAAIYRYEGAMFNVFQPQSDDDTVWYPKKGVVPEIGTKVEVSIKRHRPRRRDRGRIPPPLAR